MTQLTSTRRVVVVTSQALVGLALGGLIVGGLVAAAIILRPTPGAAISPKAPALQAPARDDFGFRNPTVATSQDDYGLRHNDVPALPATSRSDGSDDYGARHPSAAAGATDSQRSSDFGLRHTSWSTSAIGATRDDYGLR